MRVFFVDVPTRMGRAADRTQNIERTTQRVHRSEKSSN